MVTSLTMAATMDKGTARSARRRWSATVHPRRSISLDVDQAIAELPLVFPLRCAPGVVANAAKPGDHDRIRLYLAASELAVDRISKESAAVWKAWP